MNDCTAEIINHKLRITSLTDENRLLRDENKPITAEYLREILDYDPATGVFRHRNRARELFKTEGAWKIFKKRFAGKIAGCLDAKGYVQITINGVLYKAHRLAWLHTYGEFPKNHIDHINRNPADNRIENLRNATCSENNQNKGLQKNNTTGVHGVARCGSGYMARRQLGEKRHYLGTFDTVEKAASALRRFDEQYRQRDKT